MSAPTDIGPYGLLNHIRCTIPTEKMDKHVRKQTRKPRHTIPDAHTRARTDTHTYLSMPDLHLSSKLYSCGYK